MQNSSINNSYSFCKERGSSLIGVAILTVVMGALMSGGIFLLQNYQTIKSDQRTTDNAVSLETAIRDFVATQKRYPCPAQLSVAPDEPGFGQEDCSIADVAGSRGEGVKIGTVPVRTLNIPDKMMVDGYSKRQIYAVTSAMTAGTPDLKNGLGSINIVDENGDSISSTAGYVVYAVVSPGEDNRGAYSMQGDLLEPCAAAGDASENCNLSNGTFVSSSLKSFRGEDTDFTHRFAFKASTPAYSWHTSAWSNCGTDDSGAELSPRPTCFSSTQARSVECRDKQGTVVPVAQETDSDKCGHTVKPDDVRPCSLGPCRWSTSPASC